MRIDDLNRSAQTLATEKATSVPSARGRESDVESADGDNTEISSLAHALQPQDSQRLEQLRLDVQGGQYRVSGEKVAKAVLDEAIAATS
jgi:anti-sigma28 factor (negative regulator of flagellin synthesis)